MVEWKREREREREREKEKGRRAECNKHVIGVRRTGAAQLV